jgi:hypothetical protein
VHLLNKDGESKNYYLCCRSELEVNQIGDGKEPQDRIAHKGIVDSRALHYPSSGLMRARFQNPLIADQSVLVGKEITFRIRSDFRRTWD